MWFIFALLGSLLWTIVSLYDQYSVKVVFTRASQGLFVSGMFSGFGLILVMLTGWNVPTADVFVSAMAGAILLQVSQYYYFQAMESEEVGDLVAYGSTYPLLVALIAIPLGKALFLSQWAGILVVIVGVACIEWKRTSHTIKAKIDISGYVVGLAISSIIIDQVLDAVSFVDILLPYSLGLILGGFSPFIFKKERQELIKVWPKIKNYLPGFGLIEVVNVAAIFCEVYAIGIGHPALVNTVASAEPAFVFIFAQLLSGVPQLKEYFPKNPLLHHKLLIVVIIAIGLSLVAIPR